MWIKTSKWLFKSNIKNVCWNIYSSTIEDSVIKCKKSYVPKQLDYHNNLLLKSHISYTNKISIPLISNIISQNSTNI